jgi:hypothetical protein
MDKMVTTGRLLLHLQRAPKLSSQWGPPQRKLLLNLVEVQRRNDILVIFSVLSNTYELVALLNSWKANLIAYIDYYDALGLLDAETSDEYGLILFSRREIL